MRTSAPWPRTLRGLACLALLACGIAGAEVGPGPATVLVADDLRRSPGDRSAVVGSVSAGDEVEVLEIRGDQARVEAGSDTGWMPLDRLGPRGAVVTADAGGSWFGGLAGALSGRERSPGDPAQTATQGIRGLQRENLANAVPDPRAVERMESWRASPEDGAAYGRAVGLESRTVEYREASR